jgi:hypothetical protein
MDQIQWNILILISSNYDLKSLKIPKADDISGAGTAYPSRALELTYGFSGVRVTRSLVLCVCFVDSCVFPFFWPLCYLSFDLRILIIPLARKGKYLKCNFSVISLVIYSNPVHDDVYSTQHYVIKFANGVRIYYQRNYREITL